MMSKQSVKEIPQAPANELRKLEFFCKACAETKARRMSYSGMKGTRTSEALHTVHMDTCGPMRVMGQHGAKRSIKHTLVIIDDATSFRWTYLLESHTHVHEKIKELCAELKAQKNWTIKVFRTDGGTEFNNKKVKQFCVKKGIIFQMSNPYCPEENGAAERDHATKFTRVRCVLKDSHMPAKWWPEAIMFVEYIQNRTPMERLGGISPFEKLYGVNLTCQIYRCGDKSVGFTFL